MNTSYFAKYKGENGVSIAKGTPIWFKGGIYKPLCPPWSLINKYKSDGDKDYYIKRYYEIVLKNLDPIKVYNDLGSEAVLMCWEKSGDFCHRHIVAEWLEKNIGITIKEI